MGVKLILWYTEFASTSAIGVCSAPFPTDGNWRPRFIQEGWNACEKFQSAIIH
jgi:hypothetical protein